MHPLVSIIIPTAGRPQYLSRALDSALAGMDPKDVEVIVVPNGPDESWREALRSYHNNQSVRVIRIMEANANIARNAGLDEARGEFVRFLDDDDYLIPEGAVKQYALIKSSNMDVVSGSVQLVDEQGRCFDTWHQPNIDDLCAAVLGPWRNCATSAHVYRLISLGNTRWNPETAVRQDFQWLFDLCTSSELSWGKTKDVVGIWQHHWGHQISSSIKFNEIRKLTVPMLMRAHDRLLADERLTDIRRRAIAQGLWGCIHAAFFLDPLYWHQVTCTAREIYSSSKPVYAFYNFPVIRQFDPLFLQWLMLPKRWLFYQVRQLLKKWRFRHSW